MVAVTLVTLTTLARVQPPIDLRGALVDAGCRMTKRINVTLPDELAALVRERMPGLNVSGLLQRALAELVECAHDHLGCKACGATVERARIARVVLDAFYRELVFQLHTPISRCATAEGAARVLRDVARSHGVDVDRAPLPRATASQRARAAAELRRQAERDELALFEACPGEQKPRRRAAQIEGVA